MLDIFSMEAWVFVFGDLLESEQITRFIFRIL
jgi:hypothetical protein